jgi:hypothetical protein
MNCNGGINAHARPLHRGMHEQSRPKPKSFDLKPCSAWAGP